MLDRGCKTEGKNEIRAIVDLWTGVRDVDQDPDLIESLALDHHPSVG